MTRERGQALIETVAALPACVACALLLVDAGTIVRDRMAVAQAASRAAAAELVGADPVAAARDALPGSMRGLDVDVSGSTVRVSATSRSRAGQLAGITIRQASAVSLVEEAR